MHRVTMGTLPPTRHDPRLMAYLRQEPFEGILYANRAGTCVTVPKDGLLFVNSSPHEPGKVVRIKQGDTLTWFPGYLA